jgi:hypothetical protein
MLSKSTVSSFENTHKPVYAKFVKNTIFLRGDNNG